MSKLFAKVREYYYAGLYTKKIVGDFVNKGKLTAEEYELITKDPWVETTE